ncbi:hypothetical protein DFH09DRAFT_1376046 [Mycena vulgaris]|nr:hypothetical protein DFH09DRAFT_1376046 [Mycena vulgaris]
MFFRTLILSALVLVAAGARQQESVQGGHQQQEWCKAVCPVFTGPDGMYFLVAETGGGRSPVQCGYAMAGSSEMEKWCTYGYTGGSGSGPEECPRYAGCR